MIKATGVFLKFSISFFSQNSLELDYRVGKKLKSRQPSLNMGFEVNLAALSQGNLIHF